jgi:hypothetical protein
MALMGKTPGQLDRDIAEALVISVTEDALEAFWRVVARKYPQAKTGDLSPGTHHALQRAAQAAVAEWVEANVPAKFRT